MRLFLLFLAPFFVTSTPAVESLRNSYFNAAVNKNELPSFLKSIENVPKKDHIYYCYISAYYSLEANFSGSITRKLKFFNLCKENLAKSFSIKDNFDARFIRFCIQSESPVFLGYTQNLEEDKKYILTRLKNETSGKYKLNIKAYLSKCKALNEKEKEKLEGL